MIFPHPENVTEGTFDRNFRGFFGEVPDVVMQKVLAVYPYQGPGDLEWKRVSALHGDVIFNCNNSWLSKMVKCSYRYIFNIPPAFHGMDVAYTFYNGPGIDPFIQNDTAAIIHQEYITDYVIHGEPGCADTKYCWPKYGSEANTMSLNVTEFKVIRDPWYYERCVVIEEALEYA
jgi:carboxylesterase type B